MTGTRIVLFDLDSEHCWGAEIVRLLEASAKRAFQVTREEFSGTNLLRAHQKVSSIASLLVPDTAVFVFGDQREASPQQLFDAFRLRAPGCPIIAVALLNGPEEAQNLLKWGANDFLIPPICETELRTRVWRWLGQQPRHEETSLKEMNERLGDRRFIGRSEVMREALRNLFKISEADATVLISGETGTGKEVTARAIHSLSSRAAKPFVAVDCATIPENLMESTLFGRVAGAFTGASNSAKGFVQEAEGGTLFLDEIDALTIPLQAKLLRILQEGEFVIVGSPKNQTANIRVIAASNADLEEQVKARAFRADLYHRLNVLPITMSPLRKRPEDIEPLARYFIDRFCRKAGKAPKELSPGALKKLVLFDWPGNVRQLENTLRRTVIFSEHLVIDDHEIRLPQAADAKGCESFKVAKDRATQEWMQQNIKQRLAAHAGNISQAARAGGQDPSSLRAMIRKYQVRSQPHEPLGV